MKKLERGGDIGVLFVLTCVFALMFYFSEGFLRIVNGEGWTEIVYAIIAAAMWLYAPRGDTETNN